jgi:hypothetical protein
VNQDTLIKIIIKKNDKNPIVRLMQSWDSNDVGKVVHVRVSQGLGSSMYNYLSKFERIWAGDCEKLLMGLT